MERANSNVFSRDRCLLSDAFYIDISCQVYWGTRRIRPGGPRGYAVTRVCLELSLGLLHMPSAFVAPEHVLT